MLSSISAFLLLSVAIKIGAIPLEQSVVEIPLKFVTESKEGHPLRPMNDLYSKYMIGPIKGIGTPSQKLDKVIFTLSSGDFWVQNSEARKALHCPYDNPVDGFDLHNSTSYESTRKKFETYSFKGNVTGKVGKDIINIGGPMIARTLFGNAKNFSCFFVENSISGVMGLGWPQIANSNLSRSPVYDGLRRKMSKMFSIHIDSKNGEGSITFGQSNRQNCQQNGCQYTPVSQRGFWQFGTTGFSIGSHRHNQFQQAILLESVPFILDQIDDINRLTIELGPSAGFSELSRTIIVGCKEYREGKLPNVTFHLGNGVDLDLVLALEDYVDIDGAIDDICPTYFAYKADFYKTNVLPGNLTGINWIFGRPIMSKYCTSYHFDLRNIGFTLAKKQ